MKLIKFILIYFLLITISYGYPNDSQLDCAENNAGCIADLEFGDIAYKSNGTWYKLNISISRSIYAVACTNSDGVSPPFCILSGVYNTLSLDSTHKDTKYFPIGLRMQSTDGGKTWEEFSMPYGGFYMATCSGKGANAICIDGGSVNGPSFEVTRNGGKSWEYPLVLPGRGMFLTANCNHDTDRDKVVCIAGGNDANDNPLLIQSLDGAKNWRVLNLNSLPTHTIIYSTSCTGTGKNTMCVAVGVQPSYKPLLIQTTNGGMSWETITPDSNKGALSSVSCTGSGATAMCIAVGKLTEEKTLMLQTVDGGKNWLKKPSESKEINGILMSASCIENNKNSICVAVGQVSDAWSPLIMQSTNRGLSWEYLTFKDRKGMLKGVKCTLNEGKMACVAVGQPLLIAESENGKEWDWKTIH